MTPSDPVPPHNLDDQVSAASDAVQRAAADARAQAVEKPPADRRGLALVTALAFAATLWASKDRLRGGEPDRELLRAGMQGTIEMASRSIEAQRAESGTLPASLEELGYAELPITYTPTATGYRLVGITLHGDTITYVAPEQPAPGVRP